jgi:hypothetical protein
MKRRTVSTGSAELRDPAAEAPWRRAASLAVRVMAVLSALIVAGGAYLGVAYWRLNAWLDDGAGSLTPREIVLIDGGELRVEGVSLTGPLTDDAPAPTLDAMILRALSRDRTVRHLSRGEPFSGPLGRVLYVKVYMETELVNNREVTRPILSSIRYRVARDGYRLLGMDTLGI